MKFILIFFVIFLNGAATATPSSLLDRREGGWTSGGGEILEDAHNPWFIQTYGFQSVTPYCIEQDTVNFPVSPSRLRKAVDLAFQHWIRDFKFSHVPNQNSPIEFYLMDNMFVERPCPDPANSDDADKIKLRFQFGTLSSKQLSDLSAHHIDPRHFVSLAIRESYDRQSLEGRGYIYLSPTDGPLRLDLFDQVQDPWNENENFYLVEVIKHELGHVFGIPHMGGSGHLMNASYPEMMVTNAGRKSPHYSWVFSSPIEQRVDFVNCLLKGSVQDAFFDLSPTASYIGFKQLDNRDYEISSVSGVSCENSELAGVVHLNGGRIEDYQRLVSLWVIPDVQQRFPSLRIQGPQPMSLDGPMVVNVTQAGKYETINGITKPLTLFRTPMGFRIGGLIGDHWEVNVYQVMLPEY